MRFERSMLSVVGVAMLGNWAVRELQGGAILNGEMSIKSALKYMSLSL